MKDQENCENPFIRSNERSFFAQLCDLSAAVLLMIAVPSTMKDYFIYKKNAMVERKVPKTMMLKFPMLSNEYQVIKVH